MELLLHAGRVLLGTAKDVLPIAGVILGFQIFVLRRRVKNAGRVALGFFFVLIGLSLFLLGLEEALFPLGRLMAGQLTAHEFIDVSWPAALIPGFDWLDYAWVYAFAFAIGFATAAAPRR